MLWLTVFVAAFVAGFVTALTGFGGGIVLMMVLPYFFDMMTAPAYSATICLGLSATLAWRFRKHFDWRASLLPIFVYIGAGMVMIHLARGINLELLSLLFGIFLLLLATYFFLFSNKLHLRATWKTAVLCSAISGAGSGLFGIGGPLMAVYYLDASKSKESYVANMQWLFFCSAVMNTVTRLAKGIYTVDMIPVSLAGLVLAMVGKSVGLRVFDKLDSGAIRKMIYVFVAVSGLIKVIQYFV